MHKSTLSLADAVVVTAICFGLFILWSVEAVLAGFPAVHFSDANNAWMIGLEVTLALGALLYLRARRFDLRPLYPRPTLRGTAIGCVLFLASWGAGAVITSALFPPGTFEGAELSFSVSIPSAVALALVNGAYEEIFLLGVLVRGLRNRGVATTVGVSLLVRILYHLYQGPIGVVWVATIGAVLTLAYVARQDLWPPVLAHVLWDIVATV